MSSISLPSISSSRNSVRPSVCRILSANQIEYNNLLSRRKELHTQLSQFKEENAVLQAQQARMRNAITGFESEDQDTVKKHSGDLHMLNEEMRAQIRKIRKTEQRLLKKVQL
jgi:Ciliary protein causing Leber congenital amaurosis disease